MRMRMQEPTDKFALALTRNAFPGAPIRVGKKRINEPKIQAVVVNNKVGGWVRAWGGVGWVWGIVIYQIRRHSYTQTKQPPCLFLHRQISNVCPGGGGGDGGVGDAEKVCEAVAKSMGFSSGSMVLPSSTGVIGWRLPVQAIIDVVVRVTADNL